MRLICALLLASAAVAQSPALIEKSQRAKAAMDAARYEEAAGLYRQLTAALPGNTGLRMNLALALHSAGHYREAIPHLRAVLKQQPGFTAAWLVLGLAYLKLDQPAQAVAPLVRVVRAQPANQQARLELAGAYLSTARPREAVLEFRKLAELDPGFPKAWQGLGLAYIALSQQSFSALEKAAPDSPLRLVLLARSTADRGQSRSAMRLYRDAIAKAPELRYAHAGLAEVYRRSGHPDWAEDEERRERALAAPNCASASLECDFVAHRHEQVLEKTRLLRTPEAYYWQSRAASELARQALARLAALPPSPAIHELLAEAARLQRNYTLAASEWREALKLAPNDVRLEKNLARALWLSRDYENARPLLEKLVRQEPGSAELQLQLGDALLAEDANKAIPHLEIALRLAPGDAGAHAALGRAYMRLEHADLAIPHLKAALSLDQDGRLYYQLSQAYAKAGQRQLSESALAEYKTRAAAARARRPGLDEDEN